MTSVLHLTNAHGERELTNKGLISGQLWDRLVDRIVKDESVERPLAERIMDQALGFLRLVSIDPTTSYSPSPLVDIGWHTFILYTREYALFCDRVAGFFIHHAPSDIPGKDYGTGRAISTVEALRRHGLTVDEMLWDGAANCTGCDKCNNCCSGRNHCTGGGNGGNITANRADCTGKDKCCCG